ncbi:condensation domain-containing protein [Catenulispora pinisilvae]|uniref:condensation domain-containing protein n=1 Tax=Catenulispora pinisilvae TaxID=2705253 RepID=UPI0018924094|nr:condensation domain-containing protein [Catenulispora pinisilvae]
MHLGSQPELHPTLVEERVLASVPQVRACLVVSARLRGRVQTDVLLDLQPGVDPDDDHESAVRAALTESEAATLRRVFVLGADRDEPEGGLDHHRALIREQQIAEMAGARLPGVGPGADPVPVPAERLPVEFAGDGAGSAGLAWGQHEIWQSMTRQGNWLPLGGWRPLDPGTGVEEVADELAYLHSRFPSMRTLLHVDADGALRQELSASGSTHLEVYDADPGPEAADRLAGAISDHYQRLPYDLRTEWPVRMAVVRQGGEATRMAVVMHHLALDGGGAEIMMRDVAVRASTPPAGLQQLEQARWQSSPAGRRHSDRALRHFAEILRAMPTPTFPPSGDPRRPRYWSAEFVSPALRPALAALGERTGADPARVLHAVYAIALAHVTGVHPVLFRPVIGNRFRQQLADVVCHTAQAGVVLLDVADGTVEDVIERAGPAAMNAFKHGYFDPVQLNALIEEIGRERGAELDVASFFNDRRGTPTATPSTTPTNPAAATATSTTTADDYAKARTASEFRWVERRNDPVERLFLHVDDSPETVTLTIEADTRALSPSQIEAVVREMEEVAVAAAIQPGLSTRITAG